MAKLNTFVTGVVVGLAAAAVGQELQKDPEERTWKGKVAGIPYNFNVREWGDIANEYWNPSSDQIFQPHVIGLGWGVNFAALLRRGQQLAQQAQQQAQQTQQPDQAQRRRIPEPAER